MFIIEQKKLNYYSKDNLTDIEIDNFFNTKELKNIKAFIQNIVNQCNSIDDFSLVDRTRQDNSWIEAYKLNTPMNNSSIIDEYVRYMMNERYCFLNGQVL